jgi:putative transposase
MPFVKLYYHVIWATKGRAQGLTPKVEPIVIQAIKEKSNQLECPLLAINCAFDHTHVAVSIKPTVAITDWVRQTKGLSTKRVNDMLPDLEENFRWQKGYGVLSFGIKALPFVVDYIQKQKEHHKNGALEPYMEIDEE